MMTMTRPQRNAATKMTGVGHGGGCDADLTCKYRRRIDGKMHV